MGSKFSKAVRPHVRVVASPSATAQHDANENEARQDSTPRLPDNAPTSMEQPGDATAAFSLFLAGQQLMSIEYAATDPMPPPPAVAFTPHPPPEIDVQCLICCTQLPKERDPMHAKEVLRPCRLCNNAYCITCVKKMFIEACKNTSSMPPSCCGQIHLHNVRPYLSQEEIAEFKSKYEEWSTLKPFYCPIPTCSVFIPGRLLPQQAKSEGKRVDSGIGTPTANTFDCPTCQAGICVGCRQVAHPNSLCNVGEFGIDAETEALLKGWGYKKCPKCGHGLRRMYGCAHMACRCGAHFCWGCMKSWDSHYAECDEDEEERYSDVESVASEAIESVGVETSGANPAGATVEAPQDSPTHTTTPPQAIIPPRNLDGGPESYWIDQEDLDFGAEPGDDMRDRAWHCYHAFSAYKISLATALTKDTTMTDMECMNCWGVIRPAIDMGKTSHKANETMVPAGAGGSRRGIRRGRGRGRVRYMPPRGLFAADATVGTAPHLTATMSALSQSVPTLEVSPMEDVQFTDRVVDTYGNIIATTDLEAPRRASLDTSKPLGRQAITSNALSNVFSSTTTKFSLAHECSDCGLLVCESCKDATLAALEARREASSEMNDEDILSQ
ncbi:uncharacterized protein K460DRAFT_340447 [Cucurbitaria berberidis CBS 394.84]|uniref:RING-type domain-containing protein n=1 Tax=Cucurbitaria berberidis CBS 394.84 TaxID=1168544 RepID=A0A9P4GBN9_9PLEO|nr:uncharacterized protein K460DRAFT_340447 [Cucurbitaria berberidis CBS 394.84]KAF1842893.1 hypothetical protein K460DRAFT_340447 [Cucurbitaria berberidis CBS 394.84]